MPRAGGSASGRPLIRRSSLRRRPRSVTIDGVRIARNVAIVLLLALGLTVLPAGGNVAEGVLVALSVLFAVAIGGLLVRLWVQTDLQRDALTDRQRILVYGPAGAIALMIAGADEMLATGAGTVAWIVIVAGSGWLIYNTWREARSL